MKKCTAILLTLLTLLIGVFSTLLPTTLQASADTTVYTDVLDDLEKDSTFNLQDYPAIADDYSLQVIQVAESTTGELLLYVYQPSNGTLEKDLQASYINLAVDTSGLDFNRYSLTLLDTTSTFSKYKVNGFTVSTDTYRYYTISTIYRPWISGVDENPPVGTTIQDVSYTVGFSWKTYYYNNVLSYESKSVETIDIVNPFCGTLRYDTGFSVFPFATKDSCDSHFIAFSTDRKIDKLLNAQVFYLSQDYEAVETYSGGLWYTSEKKGELIENNILLSSDTSVSVDGIFGDTYSWYRIQSVADFKKENLPEETIEKLSDKQWVLRFLETDYTVSMGAMRREYKSTVVSEASILRLKFITENKVYELKLNVIANRNDYGYDYLENDNDEYFQRKLMYKGTTGNSAIFYSYERYTDGYTDDDKPIYKFEYRYYRVYKSGDSYSIQEIYDWDSEKEDSIVKIESGYVIANNKNGKYVLYNSNFEHVYTTENPMTVKNFGDQYWFETYSEFEHKNVIYKLN